MPCRIAAAILCLVVLAGCGAAQITDKPGDRATIRFEAGYAAARTQLNGTLTAVAGTLNLIHTSPTAAARVPRRLAVLAVRFGRELGPLEALTPPAKARAAFRTLTTSLNRVEGDLHEIPVAATRRNYPGAVLAVENFYSDARAAADAAVAIRPKP